MFDKTPATKWTEYNREKHYMIEVYHWYSEPYKDWNDGDGGNKWNVYCYIYPEHPLFKKIKANGGMWQDALNVLPLHCGVTYFEPNYKKEGRKLVITSYKIGCDYNHLYDDEFTHMTIKDVNRIKYDAKRLYEYLEDYGND
jgi:hypothetical protein